jgi:hypothetical protein
VVATEDGVVASGRTVASVVEVTSAFVASCSGRGVLRHALVTLEPEDGAIRTCPILPGSGPEPVSARAIVPPVGRWCYLHDRCAAASGPRYLFF